MTVTPVSFAEALIGAIGAPESPQNVQAITAWESAEGGNWNNTAAYNPLNTTLDEPGAAAINSAGVKAYANWQQGLQATVDTLSGTAYAGIRQALAAGNDPQAVANAVTASPWGTGPFSAGNGQQLSQSQVQAGLGAAGQLSGGPGQGSATLTSANPLSALSGLANLPQTLSNLAVTGPVILAGGALIVFGLVHASGAGRKVTTMIGNTGREAAGTAATAAVIA